MSRMEKVRQSLSDVMGFVPRKAVALGLVAALAVVGVCIFFRGRAPRTAVASAIRVAQVVTDYPGASAEDVAARVTDPVETAVWRMGRVRHTTSTSYPGRSVVTVELRADVPSEAVAQAWDELQRRVDGATLPPGCSAPVVNGDYGEVYDVVYAISGDGFSPADLKAYAKALRRELRSCADVAKVDVLGDRQQIVSLEISRAKIAALGLSPETVAAALAGRTTPTDAGSLRLGGRRVELELAHVAVLRRLRRHVDPALVRLHLRLHGDADRLQDHVHDRLPHLLVLPVGEVVRDVREEALQDLQEPRHSCA